MKHLESRPQDSAQPESEEAPLGQYLIVLWRFRLVVVLAGVLGGGIGFLTSWLSPRVYEATARLVAMPVRGQEASTGAVAYAAILSNQSLVQSTLEDLGMTKPPYNLRASDFLGGNNLILNPWPDGNILNLRARVPDPQLAARFANRLADRAVALAQRIREADSVKIRDALEIQMGDARKHLDTAQRSLEAVRDRSQVDALEADVDALMDQRGQLLLLDLEVQAERAKLKKAEDELARQEPTRPFRRSTQAKGEEPPTGQAPGRPPVASEDRQPDLRDDVQSPYANPVYELLAQQVASGRTRLASLEARLTALRKEEHDKTSLTALYARRSEIDRLETEFSIARGVYENASTRYHEARLVAAATPTSLYLVDPAVVPRGPVSPRTVRNVAFGATFAAAAAAVLVLIVGSLRSTPVKRGASLTV